MLDWPLVNNNALIFIAQTYMQSLWGSLMSNNSHILTGHIDKKHLYSREGWIQAVIIFAKSVITFLRHIWAVINSLETMKLMQVLIPITLKYFFQIKNLFYGNFSIFFIELSQTILAQVQKNVWSGVMSVNKKRCESILHRKKELYPEKCKSTS